jgi:hypothetical protein
LTDFHVSVASSGQTVTVAVITSAVLAGLTLRAILGNVTHLLADLALHEWAFVAVDHGTRDGGPEGSGELSDVIEGGRELHARMAEMG